jgi:lysophospholipid acyltransferase (LPLAT)-like uncharacterized protein
MNENILAIVKAMGVLTDKAKASNNTTADGVVIVTQLENIGLLLAAIAANKDK